MEYRIDLTGNVAQEAAAGAAALKGEGSAADAALASLHGFGAASAQLEATTKAAHGLAEALAEIARAKASSTPAFSAARDEDFKRSKWEAPPSASTAAPSSSGAASGAEKTGGAAAGALGKATGAAGSLVSGISKVTLGLLAYGAALAGVNSISDLTRMAIGWRTMGQLQLLAYKATMDLRRSVAGVDAKPLVRAFTLLESNISKSTVTGSALSGILTRGFNAVFGSAEKLAPALSNAFQLGVLGALKLELAWVQLKTAALPLTAAIGPLADAVGELLGDFDAAGAAGAVWTEVLADITQMAAAATLVVRGLTGAIRGFRDDGIKGAAIGFAEGTGAISKDDADLVRNSRASGAGDGAYGAADAPSAWAETQAPDASAAGAVVGTAIGDGIVEGIEGSASAVGNAGEHLGKLAVAGARRGADAHSPSRATERLGRDMDQGAVQGLEGGASGVDAAARAVGRDAVEGFGAPTAGGGKSGNAKSSSPAAITFGPVSVSINVNGKADGDILDKLRSLAPELAQEIFRIVSMQLGLAVPATAGTT